jgi:hypothetical protein
MAPIGPGEPAAPSYPAGTVRALLATDAVTGPTRRALEARLDAESPGSPSFFDGAGYADLEAACARLLPQRDRAHPLPLAAAVDARLAEGRGDGWRYDVMPEDGEAYRRGLLGLNETARILFGAEFRELNGPEQDRVLTLVQRDEAPGEAWRALSAARFFEELLAEIVEAYYAHPLAQEEIGYAGIADAPGWRAIGLGEREEREPARGAP